MPIKYTSTKEKRQLNYEILRIVAMIMIVCLHCLNKGGLLDSPQQANIGVTGYTAWLIEAFCIVAVNCYVLISGYFGVSQVSKSTGIIKRPFRVWKQVLFYSLVIGMLALIAGIQKFDIYQIIQYIFPIVTEHYWFATSYIVLCLFMPFLNSGIKILEKKELQGILGIMLLIFCIAKTCIPMHLPWDNYGYDAYWFVILYLTGAYIKRYNIKLIDSRLKALFIYFISEIAIFLSFVFLRLIFFRTGSLGEFISYAYTYNHLFCYIGAVGLFMAFQNYKKTQDKNDRLEHFRKPIELISSATFGVYLIHEHINIRDKWGMFVDAKKMLGMPVVTFVIWLAVIVCTVYLICTCIELCRQFITSRLRNVILWIYNATYQK